MPRIVMLSMFGNSADYVERYMLQAAGLRDVLAQYNHELRLVLCEGDSTDDTWEVLKAQALKQGFGRNLSDGVLDMHLFQHHHGDRIYGSMVHAKRFANLDQVWRAMFSQVRADDDVAILVESDLIWEPLDMWRLVWRQRGHGGMVAPWVWYRYKHGEVVFYDTWAYRAQGRKFGDRPPFHPALDGQMVMDLDSAGSCLCAPAEYFRNYRTTPDEELVGFCKAIRGAGHPIRLMRDVEIWHPTRR